MTIQEIFKNFKVNGVDIPVELLKYKGPLKTYVTYQETNNEPALNGDDEVVASIISYDFDIYSNRNYKNIVKEIKRLMKINGYMWSGDGPDQYEEDTKLYHKTITFEIQNMEV